MQKNFGNDGIYSFKEGYAEAWIVGTQKQIIIAEK